MQPYDPDPCPGQVLWPTGGPGSQTYSVPIFAGHSKSLFSVRHLHVTEPCLVLGVRMFMGGRSARVVLSDGSLHYVLLEMLEVG
jgi:hypothetical protein